MQTNGTYEFDAVCLGLDGSTATWTRKIKGSRSRIATTVVISKPGFVDDGAFVQASSVTIDSIGGLMALRHAIEEALRYDMPEESETETKD